MKVPFNATLQKILPFSMCFVKPNCFSLMVRPLVTMTLPLNFTDMWLYSMFEKSAGYKKKDLPLK